MLNLPDYVIGIFIGIPIGAVLMLVDPIHRGRLK